MSSLSLADVRWRARRNPAGGPPLVQPSFVRAAAPETAAIQGIAGYFQSLLGRPREEYDPEVPVTIAGERRLGRGLAGSCLAWYRWRSPAPAEALPPSVLEHLEAAGIGSSSALRLRLFDLVNEMHDGFVPRRERAALIAHLARGLGLTAEDTPALERALTLDAPEAAVLDGPPSPPSVEAVAGRYNRAVLAALLRRASRVTATLHAPSGGLIRRLYALCRRLGLYLDIERAGMGPDAMRLSLAGPEAVTGPPAAAGSRLAVIVLRLLRALGPLDTAVADLHLRGRLHQLMLDPALLRLPGFGPVAGSQRRRPADRDERGDEPADAEGSDDSDAGDLLEAGADEEPPATFDSAVEAGLARSFAALKRQGRAQGWRLVREPAPLLAGDRVLVPDFALVRGDVRVFVEVVGFWTPAYLTRKRHALAQLPPETPLVLVTAEHALTTLAGLPFPLVPYRTAIALPDLLIAVERHFGDFAARTQGGAARLASACAAAEACGWIPEPALLATLGCYSTGEVVRLLDERSPPDGWQYLPGFGLCGAALRSVLTTTLNEVWREKGPDTPLTLGNLRARLAGRQLPADDSALAAVLDRLPACVVVRDSLFDLTLRAPGVTASGKPTTSPATGPSPEDDSGESRSLRQADERRGIDETTASKGQVPSASATDRLPTVTPRRPRRRPRPSEQARMTALFGEDVAAPREVEDNARSPRH